MDEWEDFDEVNFDEERDWHVPPAEWPKQLRDMFLPLGPFREANAFVESAPASSLWRTLLCNALCRLPLDDFDVKAWLRMGPVHLLTRSQLERLFAAAGIAVPLPRVLDVGAGEGHVTAALRPLCASLLAAETSTGCARRLRRGGLAAAVWREDVAATAPMRKAAGEADFSLVSLFNVLDRCAAPRRLLRACHTLLPESVERDGWLLLSTPLPFCASFYGWRSRWSGEPLEALGLEAGEPEADAGAVWAAQARQLLEDVLPSLGFAPKVVSRVPYLTAGDAFEPCLELDDLVVLAKKR